MPPAGRRRPDEQTLEAFVTRLERELDHEASTNPNPGRPADHRLNRFEYGNAIRDLLALEIDPGSLLPADESDHGLDNIAEVLSMSPTLLERHMLAARKISRLAIGDPTIGPGIETFNLSRGLRQDERMSEDLPFGTRCGTAIRHYFPLDGDYVVKIRLGKNFTNSKIRAIDTREQIDVLLDGAPVRRFRIGGECVGSDNPECVGTGYYRTSRYDLTADEALEVRFPATAGMHSLGVAFVKKSVLTEGPAPALLPPRHTSSTYEAPRMDIDQVRLEGPYDPTGPGDTPSRRRIFVCRPAAATEIAEESCAKEILTTLARRAYRRLATDSDVEMLLLVDREREGRRTRLKHAFGFRQLPLERDPHDARAGLHGDAELEVVIRPEHVVLPVGMPVERGIFREARRCRLRVGGGIASYREPPDTPSVDADVELLWCAESTDVVDVGSLKTDLERVLSVDLEVMANGGATPRPEGEVFAETVVLIEQERDSVRFDKRTTGRSTDGKPADPSSRRHVSFQQRRRDREDIRHVVKAVAVGVVGRKHRCGVDVNDEQVTDRVLVLGSVQAMEGFGPAWIRAGCSTLVDSHLQVRERGQHGRLDPGEGGRAEAWHPRGASESPSPTPQPHCSHPPCPSCRAPGPRFAISRCDS